MALYSLVVSCHGLGFFNTQVTAGNAMSAAREFLRTPELKRFMAGRRGWPKSFGKRDIYSFIPMAGKRNLYVCDLGRDGKYISITVARTVSRQEPGPALEKRSR